ncbi:ABC transporter substrate-binding protein [Xenophilus sp. AP218F]|nr:ABC transporter substrate-binding protein [Chromobacterium sp. ASV5]OWY40143.1 ABC transporter substrate-binding protein [Xenophilus sp. AP218F]
MNKLKTLSLALALAGAALPLHAADMSKVVRTAFEAPETGFDPAKVSDTYSSAINENIFDPLITYDYNARPPKLIPNTIVAMPAVSADGKVYTFKIKPGIFFADDPAFKGKKRELTAEDYAYSLKRFADPKVNSPTGYLISSKLAGLEALAKAASKSGKLDYSADVPGIKVLDKYTLQLTLSDTNFNLAYVLAMPHFGAVAREVIEANASNTAAHPVGTGPYRLKEWKPGNKIVLEANPNYRKVVVNGKTVPLAGRVEVSIIEEDQPRWLSFSNKQLDVLDVTPVPQTALPDFLNIDPKNPTKVSMKPAFAKTGIKLERQRELEVTYAYFNMEDPVVGGYGKDKIALRRAIAMAFPRNETIANIRRGQAVPVNYLIPAGVAGHNANFKGAPDYNPAAANALLDKFGYKIGADGYRTLPDGKPLAIEKATSPSAINKQWDEYYQKAFDSLKIRFKLKTAKWNELNKASHEGKLQMWSLAWSADFPDGENFMQLLYGPNSGDGNAARFKNAEFDRLYAAALKLPHGAERNKLYDQMNKVAAAYQPWMYLDTRIRNYVAQPYVGNFKKHPVMTTTWRYLDLKK